MSNQVNSKYIYGSTARAFSYFDENTNIIEFPRVTAERTSSMGRHGRKQTLSNRARVELGEAHFRNLMGAPSRFSSIQLALSGSVFAGCGTLIVLLSSIL